MASEESNDLIKNCCY